MGRRSNGTKRHLAGAPRCLGTADASAPPTPRSHKLVVSFKIGLAHEAWADIIFDAYGPVIGDLDLETGSYQQLNDAFRNNGGLTPSVADRAVRFLIMALDAAQVSYSPHFKPPG